MKGIPTLKPKKRISKEDLKSDEFVTLTSDAISFFVDYRKQVYVALGVVAVIFIGIMAGFYLMRSYNERATELFSLGFTEFHPAKSEKAEEPKTQTKESLEKAAGYFKDTYSKYPRSTSAPLALYYLGVVELRLIQVDEAITSFTSFLDRYKSHELALEAGSLLGTALMAKGEYQKALDRFQSLAKTEAASPASQGLNKLREGICYYHLARVPEARQSFQKVVDDYATTPWVAEAKNYLTLLPAESGQPAAASGALPAAANPTTPSPAAASAATSEGLPAATTGTTEPASAVQTVTVQPTATAVAP
jgi:tetratricopeptide (TPR) repeat protein